MVQDVTDETFDDFVEDPLVTEVLGGYISKNLVQLKTKEFEEYNSFTGKSWAESRPTITSWELERYLTRC